MEGNLLDKQLMDTIEDVKITESEKIENIKRLVALGADVNYMNYYESTPLIYAIMYSTPNVVGVLLSYNIKITDSIPLLRSIETQSLSKVELLLSVSKDVINDSSDKQTYGGYYYAHFTPLIKAIQCSTFDIFHTLLKHGATIVPCAMNQAIFYNRVEIVNELLSRNVKLSRKHFLMMTKNQTSSRQDVLDKMYKVKMKQIRNENIVSRFIQSTYYKYITNHPTKHETCNEKWVYNDSAIDDFTTIVLMG